MVDKVTESKNSMCRKYRFSPYQHIFGCDLGVPNTILERTNHDTPYITGVIHGVESFQRAQEIRQAARKAMVTCDDQECLRMATLRQSGRRETNFEVGDYMYFWRKGKEPKGAWKGPARVIGFFENKNKIWGNYGNKVVRCSPE